MDNDLQLSPDSTIYVAGHRGLVGSAIVRRLQALGYRNMVARKRSELDLCEQGPVDTFFREHRPEFVFLAAAKEDSLLTGPLEPTNEAYAIAKIAGLKRAETYRCQ